MSLQLIPPCAFASFSAPLPQFAQVTILIVEDDRLLREVLSEELKHVIGCEVLTAEGVTQGKEILSAKKVDLVLTDFMMPDGTGGDLLRWMSQQFQGIGPSVLLMTGFGLEDLGELERRAVSFVIKKPFDPDVLIDGILAELESRVSRQRGPRSLT